MLSSEKLKEILEAQKKKFFEQRERLSLERECAYKGICVYCGSIDAKFSVKDSYYFTHCSLCGKDYKLGDRKPDGWLIGGDNY